MSRAPRNFHTVNSPHQTQLPPYAGIHEQSEQGPPTPHQHNRSHVTIILLFQTLLFLIQNYPSVPQNENYHSTYSTNRNISCHDSTHHVIHLHRANSLKVLEYLSKKGYVRTEAMLRKESEPQANGQPLVSGSTETGGAKYTKSFELLRKYTEDNLDLYRPELRKLLWPVFVYSFMDLVRDYFTKDAETFFATYQTHFERDHSDEIKTLRQVRLPSHLTESNIAKLYTENKYRLTLTTMPFYNLIQFLESKMFEGGQALMDIIREHLNIVTVDRTATAEKSIAAILAGGQGEDELPAEDEGIPGHNPGHPLTSRHDPEADAARIRLQLGPYPQDQDLQDDVRATLQDEDTKNAPKPGQSSLVDEYEQRIKREPTEDGPSRDTVPLPPSLARDVSMEVAKIMEYRDRYKMEGRTGGVGPAVSVTMYTFHNTYDRYVNIDQSWRERTDGNTASTASSFRATIS